MVERVLIACQLSGLGQLESTMLRAAADCLMSH